MRYPTHYWHLEEIWLSVCLSPLIWTMNNEQWISFDFKFNKEEFGYGYSLGTRLTKKWKQWLWHRRVSRQPPIFNPMPPKAAVVGLVEVVYRRGSCQTESPYWRHYAETDDVEILWQECIMTSFSLSLYQQQQRQWQRHQQWQKQWQQQRQPHQQWQ